MSQKYSFDTMVIHAGQLAGRQSGEWKGSTHPPLYQTAAHAHGTAESLSSTFAGRAPGEHIYMRLTNPTTAALEDKVVALEGGKGGVAVASGMAAVSLSCLALLRAGDELVASRSLFMSTYLLFTTVFRKYGITAHLVDATNPAEVEAAITDRTRLVYVETIGNPALDVPDLRSLADVAHGHGLPLVVDNTMATPWLCRPLELGADVVVHSTTKYLNGHGTAVGGVIIDSGRFDWTGPRFPDFKPFVDRKGELAFLDRVWRELHINLGTTQAPFHAWLTTVGLDTLALRMERHVANGAAVAEFLAGRPEVASVNYPGLAGHPSRAVAARQFGGKGFGAMLTFQLKDQAACHRFIDSLELVTHLANLGDCKTLVIHPRSTQYVSFTDEACADLGIDARMLRLSVGIEAIEDIKADLAQALARSEAR
jgi:O-acetylhomoserine (thiol)-lyase